MGGVPMGDMLLAACLARQFDKLKELAIRDTKAKTQYGFIVAFVDKNLAVNKTSAWTPAHASVP